MIKTRSSKIIMLSLALLGSWYLYHKVFAVVKPESVQTTATTKQAGPIKLTEQAHEFAGLAKPMPLSEEVDKDCRESLGAIETLSLNALLYDLNSGKLKLTAKCLFTVQNDLASLKGFPEVCEQKTNGKPSNECTQKLFTYKAIRTHHATINENLESLSNEVLILKLIGLFMEQAFSSVDGLKMVKQVGAKLYERMPESESAAKAAAMGYIVDDKNSKEEQELLAKILSESRQKNPDNFELFELDLIRKKSVNDPSFKTDIQDFYKRNSNAPVAQYYMGCLYWSDNIVDRARDFFRSASNNSPNDERLVETYKKSLQGNPPDKVCSVKIGFDPDNF